MHVQVFFHIPYWDLGFFGGFVFKTVV